MIRSRRRLASPALALLLAMPPLLLGGCGGSASIANGDEMHVSCLTEPSPGTCRGTKPGFYYDYQTDSCRRFLYGSCGARVPFATLEDCRRRCGGRPLD